MNGMAPMKNKKNIEDALVLPPEPKQPNCPPEKLLAALYHCWDGADRAALSLFLRGITAQQAIGGEELASPVLTLGFRKAEFISGQGRVFKAFIEHENLSYGETEEDGQSFLKYNDNGVPVEVKLYDDNPTLINLNPITYKYETFNLPNPYKDFKEKYE